MQKLIKNLSYIWNKFRNSRESFWDELEEQMVTSDISINTASRILEEVKDYVYRENINNLEKVKSSLKQQIIEILKCNRDSKLNISSRPPTVFLIVGVNGVGKTTSIAKLANMFKKNGKKVLISAADTYRSAAVEQIQYYAEILGMDIVYHQKFSDPGAVVYDSVEKAKARGTDLVIIDTAGRMQTSYNLMEELKKIKKVICRRIDREVDEILLVVDSTTGQNARNQAELFNNSLNLTGIILTKTDSTSKGGIVITIKNDLNIPIKLITNGEKLEDICYFDPVRFTELIFS
ncbi:MAG: signal recognition particle-docking protein FtsY [Actinobacteria bacterium]|nr:signal recognition particle-docking protein FtsY [Actinomycetota bacterium]MBL7123562.1 signal recognition particle-docking protein FtsY [Actinomycetota bacterium]